MKNLKEETKDNGHIEGIYDVLRSFLKENLSVNISAEQYSDGDEYTVITVSIFLGEEVISAWVKGVKNGGKYFSLSFSPPLKKSEPKSEVKSTLTEEISKENDLQF